MPLVDVCKSSIEDPFSENKLKNSMAVENLFVRLEWVNKNNVQVRINTEIRILYLYLLTRDLVFKKINNTLNIMRLKNALRHHQEW